MNNNKVKLFLVDDDAVFLKALQMRALHYACIMVNESYLARTMIGRLKTVS